MEADAQGQGTTMTDAGLARVADATLTAEWAERAMESAETQARNVGPVIADRFGVLFEVFWTPQCCSTVTRLWDTLAHTHRPAHYTYWHEGARRNREYLLALLVEAALSSNREVDAAMEAGA